jgi:hypothetical protein
MENNLMSRKDKKQTGNEVIRPGVVGLNNASKTINHKKHGEHTNKEIEVFGYMTLNDVAEKYEIPVGELASCINVPAGNYHEKIGRLKKQYDFELVSLRNYIKEKTECP